MKSFKDLNIKSNTPMIGEKIKISKVLNKEIVINDYRVTDSKFPKNKSGKCLCIQIVFEGDMRVIFSGSDVLISQIEQVDREVLPITSTIRQQGDYYEFT